MWKKKENAAQRLFGADEYSYVPQYLRRKKLEGEQKDEYPTKEEYEEIAQYQGEYTR